MATSIGTDGKPKLKRGFAAMTPEKQREIARLGGLGVPPERRSFSQDRALAASAGASGGKNSQSRRQAERH